MYYFYAIGVLTVIIRLCPPRLGWVLCIVAVWNYLGRESQ